MTMADPDPTASSLLAVAGAAVGAAAGAAAGVVLLWSRSTAASLASLAAVGVLAIAVGTTVVLLMVHGQSEPEPAPGPEQRPPDRRTPSPPWSPEDGDGLYHAVRRPSSPLSPPSLEERPASAPPALSPRVPPPARHVVYPVGRSTGGAAPSSPGAGWWEGRSGHAPAASAGKRALPATQTRTPPDLGSYLDNAQVVQCPRCGAFRVRVDPAADDTYRFECTSCGERWTWRTGETWIGIDVTPRRRSRGTTPT